MLEEASHCRSAKSSSTVSTISFCGMFEGQTMVQCAGMSHGSQCWLHSWWPHSRDGPSYYMVLSSISTRQTSTEIESTSTASFQKILATYTSINMVHFSLPVFGLLALAASVTAAPATSGTTFTFEKWVEDIISNPNGNHLSPEQAVEAKNAAVAAQPLRARAARCMDNAPGWGRANV